MIKNIIFDLGGVIVTIDPDEALRRLKELGLKNADKILDSYTQSGIFGDLEQGKISAEDFRKKLSLLANRELLLEDCKYFWLGYRKDVPKRNFELLKNLRKRGYRLILLSNTNPFMMSWARSKEFDGGENSLDDYFDALYLSYLLKVMKPNEEFFLKMLDSEKINPKESLFIDDGIKNVSIAKKLGFHTLCPKNGADFREDLEKLLKEIQEKK